VLAAALWNLAGVDLVHVPYRGAQAAYQDLLGGRVDLFFDLSPTARPQVEAGNLKALAVSGSTRLPFHPEVPTLAEAGVANIELESWFGLFAPAKTPPELLERLRTELSRIVQAPDLVETFRKAGGKPLSLSTDQAKALVKRDVDRWSKITRDLDIKPE
jgi:tripartite-type tricarboxylate transporter receptor subunit TctC